jgi:voltage-gated potassium channel
MNATPQIEMKSTAYELFIALLTLLSIANVLLLVSPFASGDGKQVILAVDIALAPIFLADFLLRLATTRSRRRYLVRGWGWADLAAVVPLLRAFRLFHVGAVLRALRSRGPGSILEELSVARAAATFYATIFLVVLVLELAGALVLGAEAGAGGANIRTPGDALWWGYVTITTVGYGDQYPVTPAGRLIGFFLLTAGVALFSVFTGFIANAFLAPRRRRLRGGAARSSVGAELVAIRALLDEHADGTAMLRTRLDALERALVVSAPGVLVSGSAAVPDAAARPPSDGADGP